MGAMFRSLLVTVCIVATFNPTTRAKAPADPPSTVRADRMLAAYFAKETRTLQQACLADIKSWDDWTARRETYRQQLREMLGLDPLPEHTPLNAVVTGKLDHDEFTVEKLHFQSRPHLYVTANLYLPKQRTDKLPAILYVCGHSKAVKDGVSFGNKTKYQHHGAWFARNGYVCLVIDTLQLGEIEGVHHGTYRENMWWWNACGYTPAGVEAWNAIRALDYLESRPEVDKNRIGVTGRSGGGAHSWYLAALDDRIKCLVPVAGITTLKNHVVDGCVEGHCDCMYIVNTYRWDYPQLAALSAPRPLLISNSDQDRIFPLDGVLEVHDKVRRLYSLAGQRDRLGLHITVGPHKDTQVLQLHAFQWFNHYLCGIDRPIEDVATPYFEPEQLRVFDKLPTDEINTRIHENFTELAPAANLPSSRDEWRRQRSAWLDALQRKCFAGWPAESNSPDPTSPASAPSPVIEAASKNIRFIAYDVETQHDVVTRLFLMLPESRAELRSITIRPVDESGWSNFLAMARVEFKSQLSDESLPAADEIAFDKLRKQVAAGDGIAFIAPRGIGPTAWDRNPTERIHIKRRFMLLGQTLDSMRVWDVRRAIQTVRMINDFADIPIQIEAKGEMAGIALYAALFEPAVKSVDLHRLATSHRRGPDFLNVLRVLDMPQTVAMVAEQSKVRIHSRDKNAWDFPLTVAKRMDFESQLNVVDVPPEK
jgi:dienelactone hydrolase